MARRIRIHPPGGEKCSDMRVMGMTGCFDISSSAGQFRFVLKARNGRTIMACELLKTGWSDGSGATQATRT